LGDFVQEVLYYLTLDQTHWLLSLALILILVPFERLFPRVKRKPPEHRILIIFTLAIFSYAAVWLFKNSIYFDTISLFLNVQIFSIAKVEMPIAIIYVISLLLIDLMVFTFHFLSHKIVFLWKLHSVHHSDEHVDAKTGILHHPVETLASFIFVLFFAVILGVPLIALVLYVGVATVHNLFSHANIALPTSLDRTLRLIIVTPDMHRTHHSVDHREGNSNFGQIFSFWDRLLGTYAAHPSTGEDKLIMGLAANEKPKAFTIKGLLLHPILGLYRKK